MKTSMLITTKIRKKGAKESKAKEPTYFHFSPDGPILAGDSVYILNHPELERTVKKAPSKEAFDALTRRDFQFFFDMVLKQKDPWALEQLYSIVAEAVSKLNFLRTTTFSNVWKDAKGQVIKTESEQPYLTMVKTLAEKVDEWPLLVRRDDDSQEIVKTLGVGKSIKEQDAKMFSDKAKDPNRPARKYAVAVVRMIQANREKFAKLKRLNSAKLPAWFNKLDTLPDDFNRTTAEQWGKLIREMIMEENADFWKRNSEWEKYLDEHKEQFAELKGKTEWKKRKICLDAIEDAVPTVAR